MRVRNRIQIILILAVLGCWQTVSADLVGYWTFDEGSGDTVADSSGNGYDGEILGPPEGRWWDEGVYGGAFHNRTGYVNIDPGCWSTVTDQVTIAFWIFGDSDLASNFGFAAFGPGTDQVDRVATCHLPWGSTVYFDTGGPNWPDRVSRGASTSELREQWHHWTFVKNAAIGEIIIYLDGVRWFYAFNKNYKAPGPASQFYIAGGVNGASPYRGRFDDFRIYDTALDQEDVIQAMKGKKPFKSVAPMPEDQGTDVNIRATLSWLPGYAAIAHDVYLGTVKDDVENATRDNPLGVLINQNQDTNTLSASGILNVDQTYYWRVDDVNESGGITKGDVWRFDAEPTAYAMSPDSVTISASSSFDPDVTGPENLMGNLDKDGVHGTDFSTMWLSALDDEAPSLNFEFDGFYKLHQIKIWNFNTATEPIFGTGAKDVLIEISPDGTTWTQVPDSSPLAQAPGEPTEATTVLNLDMLAEAARILIQSSFLDLGLTGLSEVQFTYLPTYPVNMSPADGSTLEANTVTTVLNWRVGRESDVSKVFFGTDPENLSLLGESTDGTISTGLLDYNTTYYWIITDVNDNEDPSSYSSDVWSFSTPEYYIVDDFDQYDAACNTLYYAWKDGLGYQASEYCGAEAYAGNGTGSMVGNGDYGVPEIVITKSGLSMPVEYNNSQKSTSEVTLQLDGENWTTSGLQTLSLYFHGTAGNTGQLYVKVNDTKVLYNQDTDDIASAVWIPWQIDLTSSTGLDNVTELTIGVEGADAAGKIYIDNVRLYPRPAQLITPVEPDNTGLVAQFDFEGNLNDTSGNSHNGQVMGEPDYVDGVLGQAINLNGINEYVVVGSVGIDGANPRTIAGWVKADTVDITAWTNVFGFTSQLGASYKSFDINRGRDGEGNYIIHVYGWDASIIHVDLEWHHLAASYDGTTLKYYGDGVLVGSNDEQVLNTEDNVQMGKRGHNDPMFPGSLDDVRIYNRVLSDAEILSLGRGTPVYEDF